MIKLLVQLGADIGKHGSIEVSGVLWSGNPLDLAHLLKSDPKFPIAIELVDALTSHFEKQWNQLKPSGKLGSGYYARY